MTTLTIYRPLSTEVVTINIDEKTIYSKRLMAEHFVRCEFIYSSVIGLQIGDFITYNSENYYINRLPDIEKINNSTYKYNVVFESVLYDLNRKLFISSDGLADYSYNGSATDFITNIVSSINSIASGWSVGTVDSSDDITLQFTNESCRAALTRVAEAFSMEFSLSGKQISLLNSVGSNTAYRFEYGKGLGLYKITRQQVSDQNILTKVYGFGATTNIPSTYRDGAKRLVFDAGSGMRYLTENTDLYGVIEGQFTDDNIFPNRTGTLSGVNYTAASGWNNTTDYLEDSSIDFDLNDYIIEGQKPTIVFKSGDNSGVECEIWKYVDATKRLYINAFTDTDGYIQPNTTVYPQIGDTYTLVNIAMPATYVTAAETALQVATQAYLDENSVPMVVYSVEVDPKYAEGVTLDLDVGDKVTIVDSGLGINSLIRVSGIEFPLVNPYSIKAVIADFVPYTLQERIIKASISNRKETVFVDRRRAEQARRNTVNQNTLRDLLFDTDMYFDTGNIKPLSIETAYLAVGTKSRDFWLSLVTIKANYGGDANAINVSAGSLVHLQISITGLGYTWVIGTPLNESGLTPATVYYLYAKCSKAALTGEWVLSSSQITVEQVDEYYHFLSGMLFAVADGYRDFDFTYGMTYINGGTITTGKIQSIDTNNYFDLTNNKFHVGDSNGYVDWNAAASGVLNVRGNIIISAASGYTNITDKPTSLAGINSSEGSKLTSVASGATVGATWGTNLNSIPAHLADTAPDNSLAFTNEFLGFHASGTNWPIKIANASGVGVFYAGDGADNYMDWNGTTLAIRGVLSGIDSNLATVAVPVGDLAGSVANTQANRVAVKQKIRFTKTSSVIDLSITINGTALTQAWNTSETQTCADFFATHGASAWAGVTLSHPGGDYLEVEANVAGTAFTYSTISATASVIQANVTAQKQIDTVTLTGESGTANVVCDGVTKLATFFNSLTDTAAGFVIQWAASYLTGGVVVTSSGVDIIFTSQTAGTAFTGATSISNVANVYRGNVKIVGNDIWADTEDNDTYGFISINRKGYNGGLTRERGLRIYNGKNTLLARFQGDGDNGYVEVMGGVFRSYAEAFDIYAAELTLGDLPSSAAGLTTGMVYREGAILKIVT